MADVEIWLFDCVPMPKTSRPLATPAPRSGKAGKLMMVPLLLVAKKATGFSVCESIGTAAGAQVLDEGHE